MTLFSDVAPIDGHGRHTISSYDYLAGSVRPEAAEARSMLEGWFEAYPKEHKEQLRSRFRARRDVAHDAAFLELCLHRVLSRIEGLSLTVDPRLPNVATSPDFEITRGDGFRAIIEATTATGLTDRERGQQRNAEILIETIRQVQSADFFLDVTIVGTVTSLEGIRTVPNSLRRFLNELSYDAVANGFPYWVDGPRGERQEYSVLVTRSGFAFRATAMPRGDMRGEMASALGTWTTGDVARYRETQTWVREAISEKANKYGNLGCPFVIAINVFDFALQTRDIVHAVLGSHQVRLHINEETREVVRQEHLYGRDGSFGTPDAPAKRNVSAVLCVNRLTPWSVNDRRVTMVHNPWAEFPMPTGLLPCRHVTFDDQGHSVEFGDAELRKLIG